MELLEEPLNLSPMRKRVLVISYYWPPSGGSGVQRWLHFVRYLRAYGWEPVVYTVENGEYPYLDPGLAALVPEGVEIIRRRIWEPYSWFRRMRGRGGHIDPTVLGSGGAGGWRQALAIWVRGNLLIPDPRCFWIGPSVRTLQFYLKAHPVDAIVSTGPPHSMHLIGLKLHAATGIPWLADFRDPWTQIFFFKQFRPGWLARWRHRRLEQTVLRQASAVVTVSRHCQKGLEELSGRSVSVVTNGFEPFTRPEQVPKGDKVQMLYAGVLTQDRNPGLFWEVLASEVERRQAIRDRFQLTFIGTVDPGIPDCAKAAGLRNVVHLPAMPHALLQEKLWEADLLLLVGVPGDPGVVTGKLFEYLFLHKPILSISPPGSDAAAILESCCAGVNAGFDDGAGMRNMLDQAFGWLASGGFSPDDACIEAYSRRNLTMRMAGLLDAITPGSTKGENSKDY
ncbi:MAG: hypothetical protein JPMHGGIA_02088 [Saprospiraceae bacterium]|nr:hypothetical protein [Saprospiraceae bacterium]